MFICPFHAATPDTGPPSQALTSVYDRLEGEVAALCVEGELVNVHPAGADQHLVVLHFNISFVIDGEIRTRRSFVLLRPAREHA